MSRFCRACWRCCTTCWEVASQERVLSPTLVIALHVALVSDVVWHRPALQNAEDDWSKCLWLLMGATLTLFLQASTVDPGWLRPKPCAFTGPGACLLSPCSMVLWACWCCRRVPARQPAEALSMVSAGREGDQPMGSDPMELAPMAEACDEELGWAAGDEGIHKRVGQIVPDTPTSTGASGSAPDKDVAPSVVGAVGEPPSGGMGTNEPGRQQRRWCKRCELYQPLRTKHCRDCGVCVRTHDHHCPWIGTCVGENNRILFLCFLALQLTELGLFFSEGVKGISILEPSAFLVVGLLTIAMLFFMVACLLSFHTYLLLSNLTTWEHVSWNRISYLKGYHCDRGSPFSKSMAGNATTYCCGPIWCPERMRAKTALRFEDSGAILWELGEPRPPNCLLRCLADCC